MKVIIASYVFYIDSKIHFLMFHMLFLMES